ncbi:hypothetical protein VTK56DRAFT_8194 [Thermocarpiscus australiensis]
MLLMTKCIPYTRTTRSIQPKANLPKHIDTPPFSSTGLPSNISQASSSLYPPAFAHPLDKSIERQKGRKSEKNSATANSKLGKNTVQKKSKTNAEYACLAQTEMDVQKKQRGCQGKPAKPTRNAPILHPVKTEQIESEEGQKGGKRRKERGQLGKARPHVPARLRTDCAIHSSIHHHPSSSTRLLVSVSSIIIMSPPIPQNHTPTSYILS